MVTVGTTKAITNLNEVHALLDIFCTLKELINPRNATFQSQMCYI